MIQALKNIWAIPELRLRMGFTFLMLAVYRIGSHIVVNNFVAEPFPSLIDKNNRLLYPAPAVTDPVPIRHPGAPDRRNCAHFSHAENIRSKDLGHADAVSGQERDG